MIAFFVDRRLLRPPAARSSRCARFCPETLRAHPGAARRRLDRGLSCRDGHTGGFTRGRSAPGPAWGPRAPGADVSAVPPLVSVSAHAPLRDAADSSSRDRRADRHRGQQFQARLDVGQNATTSSDAGRPRRSIVAALLALPLWLLGDKGIPTPDQSLIPRMVKRHSSDSPPHSPLAGCSIGSIKPSSFCYVADGCRISP